MATKFIIRDLFRLSNSTTVLACEGIDEKDLIMPCMGKIQVMNEVRQFISLTGERRMLKPTSTQRVKAIETDDVVNISIEEAKSGLCELLID